MTKVTGRTNQFTTPELREAVIARNEQALATGEKVTQAQLAEEFGLSQSGIGKMLKRYGSRTRTRVEAATIPLDISEIIDTYLKYPKLTLADMGEIYDVSWSAIRKRLIDANVPLRAANAYPKYELCNRSFFSEQNNVNAYFAGFLAADGYIPKQKRSVILGIQPRDVEILQNFKSAATLDQPLIDRVNNQGNMYKWLYVSSKEWVVDLEKNYKIVNAKSLTLQPPDIQDEAILWHFLRGYFDGDGHVNETGTSISVISASQNMTEWLIEKLGTPNSMHEQNWFLSSKQEWHTAKSLWYSGEATVRVARRLYKDSDPTCRLERKYLRLKQRIEDL